MDETVKLILSLSVSGGLLALALFMLKPLVRNRLSKSFQYYIWLVVLLRFIVPFSFGVNLMDFTYNTSNTIQTAGETVIPNDNPVNPINLNPAVNDNTISNNEPDIAEQQPSMPVSQDSAKSFDLISTLADNLLWVWLAGAVISAAFNILGYLRFIQHIHSAAYEVEIPDCGAKVYKSRFAPTPMLAGVIRARIYLPDIEYTDEQLNNILLHELTHLRRHDILLKWFAALVASVHWFNPIVYFMRREFNRACELSCDEAVICNLDGTAKQSYGDTLISVVAESRYPVGVMSVTMCEEKTKLKERLIAIMNYKKKTKITLLITAVLVVVITGSAFAFGANVAGIKQPEKALTSVTEDTKSMLSSYYSGQSTGPFEMFNKKIFAKLADDWTVEIDGIKNPLWNYDSFTEYQYLDHNMISVSRYEKLYYCTFSADNNKFGYVVMSYDGSGLQKISVVETPYLYDLRANSDKIAESLREADIDLSSVTASRVKLVDTDKNRSDEVIVFTDKNSRKYIYYFDDKSLIPMNKEDATQTINTNWSITTTNQSYDFTTYNGHEDGDELLLASNIKNNWTGAGLREQLLKNAVPNQVESIKTISATGIEKLFINAELCGIVVETAEGSEYTIDYIGVQNKASISVSTSVENGVLSVSAKGSGDADLLVSTVRGSRINVVRIGVPKNSIKEISIQNETQGCIMIDGVDVPVNGNTKSGVIRAQNKTLNADINLEAGNGNVIVKGNVVSSNITMTVANGSAFVEGDTVDGNLRLSSKNGGVNVTAGSVKNGEFTAANGEVSLKIGVIDQKVSAKVTNGELNIQLLKKPTNLRYVQTSKPNGELSLPNGWKDGYQIGNGSALLEVSVGNGELSLSVKE